MTRDEYESECSLVNPKYQLQTEYVHTGDGEIKGGMYDTLSDSHVDAFAFVQEHLTRIIQLPTIAKLTTDNQSIIEDFPIENEAGALEPYNDYAIKVKDGFGTELYIFVHRRDDKTYLLPIVIGFAGIDTSCSPVHCTDNWRVRELLGIDGVKALSQVLHIPYRQLKRGVIRIPGVSLSSNTFQYLEYADAESEFGLQHTPMMVINTTGLYDEAPNVLSVCKNSLLDTWTAQEYKSLHDSHVLSMFSSAALVLQVWLHTICMWKSRCINREVTVISANGVTEKTKDIASILSRAKTTIVDLNKDIVVYKNDRLPSREFIGFHMRESQRCGHFRHLTDGRVIYIKPTTVHYKKIVPDARLSTNCKPLIYRNSEDFLKEKSWLENEVLMLLKSKHIKYKTEKTFHWMGKKRLDFFLPEYNVGIECQGVQHFYPYGDKDDDFADRQQRDRDKYAECTEHGVILLYYVNRDIPIPSDMQKKYIYVSELNDLYELIV